jgi:tRNA nucleotidyltransferase/poly(A) polymerase
MTMTTLLPVHKITPPEWMRDPDLILVLDTLNHDDINTRMVGGCIRNYYLGKNIYDIDIACKFTPEKSSDLLVKKGIRVIPTGIKHGTITAHINGRNFEITTLRQDVKTDGRHAEIAYTDDWTLDARRRDFTINALYADRDGSIYDPTELGFGDLQTKTVRFIGNPQERIKEDYLRILRFFRLTSIYGGGTTHAPSHQACKDNKHGIEQLSDERICDEIFKILSDDGAPVAINLMQQAEIFNIANNVAEHLNELIKLQNQLNCTTTNSRYFISKISNKYIKNKTINKFFKLLTEFKNQWDNNIQLSLYLYPRDVVTQGLLILKSQGLNISDIVIARAMNDATPIMPITASDIMDYFKIPEGQAVGEKLKQAEGIWIQSNFALNRFDILDKMHN